MSALQDEIHRQLQEKMRRQYAYALGLQHGTSMCLRLLMGESAYGAVPCPQPIPDEVREWAARALLRCEATEI